MLTWLLTLPLNNQLIASFSIDPLHADGSTSHLQHTDASRVRSDVVSGERQLW